MHSLLPSAVYHIYNHANGADLLFKEPENYHFFLRRWKKYILPVADTYAYCLMPNHFHALVRFKERELLAALMMKRGKLVYSNLQGLMEATKNMDVEELASLLRKSVPNLEVLADDDKFSSFLSQQFSNLFNGYTKAINKRYRRYGSLFNPRFKRRRIISNSYLYNVLAYIHCNPVIHLFTDDYTDWLYSSWHDYEDNPTWICKDLIDEFDSLIAFRQWLDEISKSKLERLSLHLEANE